VKKIISTKSTDIISAVEMKRRQDIETFMHKYFEVVYSNCSIFDAEMIGLLEWHPRFDSRIPAQLLINQLGQDGDRFILEGNDEGQLIRESDIRTQLITQKIILKGWDTKEMEKFKMYFKNKIKSLKIKLKKERPDLKKYASWIKFNEHLATYQDLTPFKTGHTKSDMIITKLDLFNRQMKDWILKQRNRSMIKAISDCYSKKRTFILMGAAHYLPTYPLIEDWERFNFKTLTPTQMKDYLTKENDKTQEFREYINKAKTVILIPKYNQLGSLPQVEVRESVLDNALEELCECGFQDYITDDAFINLYALKKEFDSEDQNLLHLAAENNLPKSLKMLIEKGLDIDRKNENKTVLHFATEELNKSAIALLLEHNAAIDESDKVGATPLHYAVEGERTAIDRRYDHLSDQIEIVHMLLKAKANPNKKDSDGNTALHIAIVTQSRFEIVKALLEAKANPNTTNHEGETPLQLAIQAHSDPMIISLLLEKGAKVDLKSKKLFPLEIALRENNEAAIQLLLEKEAFKYGEKDLYLELAAEFSTPLIFKKLLALNGKTNLSSELKEKLITIGKKRNNEAILFEVG